MTSFTSTMPEETVTAAATRLPLQAGDPQFAGNYRLTARLGSGGMGVVYLGEAGDGRLVAVKVMRPELAGDPEFRARFSREAVALTRVESVRIVRVIEAGTGASGPFLVTEYAAGPSLAGHIDLNGPLRPGQVCQLAAGLAEALTVIHEAKVVHRDLKPSNVILAADGPKVIDFGIAQVLDSVSLTRTGTTIGSPGLMAPEQFTGQAGPAADVFAWAVTVAYAASGQPPFGTGPTDALMYRIVHAQPDIAAVPEVLRPLLAGHGATRPERASVSRSLAATPFGRYGGEQTRGVFQGISRIVASGRTIVTTGTQVSDGVARQQFLPRPTAAPPGGWPRSARRAAASRRWVSRHPAGGRPAGLAGHRAGCHLDQPGRAVLDAGGHPRDHPAAAWRPGLRPHRHRRRVPGRRPGPGPRRPDPGGALDLGRRRDLAADDGRAGRAG